MQAQYIKQECLEKLIITWKLRKGSNEFASRPGRPDLIPIPIKLHEDIPNGY